MYEDYARVVVDAAAAVADSGAPSLVQSVLAGEADWPESLSILLVDV
jgi:hypothetical protein